MSLQDMMKPQALTESEFEAARNYVSSIKDSLDGETKAGLLKLIRAEEYRQMFGDTK